MTNLEKIQLLLDSCIKENNYIVICLMLEVLGLSFGGAFVKLQFYEEAPCKFCIEIAEIRIFYDVELFKAIDVPSDWGYINRYISVNGKSVDDTYVKIYIEEDIAWRLNFYPEEKVENLTLLQNDIKDIVPIIKTLFEQVQTGNK
jgi:hypothetical protein